jgi:hypothetical protein
MRKTLLNLGIFLEDPFLERILCCPCDCMDVDNLPFFYFQPASLYTINLSERF